MAPNPQPPPLRLPVNTSHHQSVAVPAPNLRIAARCPDDDIIEAIELIPPDPQQSHDPKLFHVEQSPQRLLLGVQWHPERSYDISPASRALFQALITAAQPNP